MCNHSRDNKLTILIMFLSFLTVMISSMLWLVTVHADVTFYDKQGNQYNKSQKDIISKSFDACNCLKEGRKFFTDLRDDQIQELCIDSYTKILMEKSKDTNSIQVGSYITCQEK